MYARRELLRRICLTLPLIGPSAARAQMTDLVATLSARLGITREQAVGGAGAVFRLARQRLSPAEFSIIAESVPGIDRVLDAAPAVGETASGIADLALPFSLLGMPSSLIVPFVEIVLDFVRERAGCRAAPAHPVQPLRARQVAGGTVTCRL